MNSSTEFYLKNIKSKLSLQFEFSDLHIKINSIDSNIENLATHYSEDNLMFETGILIIDNSNDHELHYSVAQAVRHLLSLAMGQEIIFDRQVRINEKNREEIKRKMSVPTNEGQAIIPEFGLAKFLKQTLQNWIDLGKSKQDDLFIIINYLNQTKIGYIEDRILRTTQAWEAFARFKNVEIKLNERLEDLRKDLISTYKTWRTTNDNSDIDPNGEIGNKIVTAINQEKLLGKLNNLLIEFDINSTKLKLNLRELKRLRDSVAHTGKIDITGKKAINVLLPAVKSLQIILLLHLGYDDTIISEQKGWRTFEGIKSFQNGAQHSV